MPGNATTERAEDALALLGSQVALSAILARTSTVHRPVGLLAYDCAKNIVVRDGSAVLFSEFGQKPVKVGDVIVLGASILCGSEPEGHIRCDPEVQANALNWAAMAQKSDELQTRTGAVPPVEG